MKIMKFRSLILAGFLALPFGSSYAQVEFSVNVAPPPLPVYEQPACPAEGYIWTPGYWGWGQQDYYWVPGAWVPPPSVGLLWTPGWWGWSNGAYAFNQGYWGPTVGFYGGINYGYGYTGNGYWGGRWNGNNFQYNTAVTRVNNTAIHNTYVNNTFNKSVNASRTSFNGGNNGIKAQPTAQQKAALTNAKKVGPTSQQLSRQQAASKDQNLHASANKGKPNTDAIKSFDKNQGVAAGKGAGDQGPGAGAGAATGKGENKIGNANDLNRPGGAGSGQAGKGPGAAAGAGENKTGNANELNRQGAGAGQAGKGTGAATGAGVGKAGNRTVTERSLQGTGAGNGNKVKTGTPRTAGGNQAKMHTRAATGPGGSAHGPKTMNQMSHNPQMGTRNAQMGGKHPPMQAGGGNRPHPNGGQPQGKKKPGKP
jgi:hypothetical protein